MNSAVLGLITDLQSQIETLNARLERVEKRVETEWVRDIAEVVIATADAHRGLHSIGGN